MVRHYGDLYNYQLQICNRFATTFHALFLFQGNGPMKEFGDKSKGIMLKKVNETSPTSNNANNSGIEIITFGAGCFWGIELAFQRVPGVMKTEVGYTQGFLPDPDYESVCSGTTGHVEAVQVTYDSKIITLNELLTIFWDIHDPTSRNRQGGDVGTQYRSGIYFETENQKTITLQSRDNEQIKYGLVPIVTEIMASRTWYPAEEYNQKYLQKGGQCAKTGDLTPIRCYG